MRKKFKKIVAFLCLLVIIPVSIYAIEGGSTGDSQAGDGNGGDSSIVYTFYYQFGSNKSTTSEIYIDVSAYKYELAYFEPNGDREIIATVVAQDPSSVSTNSGSSSGLIIRKVKEYANYCGAKYLDSGELASLSRRLERGEALSDIFPWDEASHSVRVSNAEWILNVIKNEFGVSAEKMQKDQDENPGRYESYGYRILVQKVQLYGIGGYFTNGFAATRKEVAKNLIANNGVYRAQGINKCVQLFGRGKGYTRELYTETSDVHISNGYETARTKHFINADNGNNFNRSCNASTGIGFSGSAVYDLTDALADEKNGFGYNILWFDSESVFKNYDYTIDAACVGCDVSNSDNMAYYIQDTNDWDAIFASPDNTDNKNIRTYYDKGNGVFCREEYKVYFPNMNNQINVGTGRYFTVNVSADDLLGVGHSTFPNFKPVKVVKVRECRVDPDVTDPVKSYDALRAFEEKSKGDFSTKFGKVSFRYNETYKDSRYNMNDAEEMEPYDDGTYSWTIINSGIDGQRFLLMTASKEYTLPPNYYRYIKKDGLPVKGVPSNINQYIDLGFSSLPVSYENKGENGKAGDIQFAVELPTNDKYSKLNKAYQRDNKYLATNNSDGNLYQKFFTNKLDEDDKKLLEQSACATMFGYDTSVNSAFYNCAKQRTTNSIGNPGYNCVDRNKLSLTGRTTQGYSCIILSDGGDGGNQCYIDQKTGTYYGLNGTAVSKEQYYKDCPCNDETDARDLGVDWNPVKKMCCPVGTTFNEETGECDKNENACKTEADAERLGREWNAKHKYCCPAGTKYNSATGECDNNGGGDDCKTEEDAERLGREWNATYKYCCPAGTKYNSNTGKCDSTKCYIKDGKYYDNDGKQISKEEYDRICPGPVTYECPPEECEYGCCPSGECAPMPTINGEPYCTGPGGIDVIYRTIDLEDPFPGQDAENRETGSNWCSYNIKLQKFSCAYNNQTVKEYITRERNSAKNGSKVYDENHVLYEVTLDAETINKVRSYNDKHKYDDWTLKCLDNGKACQSEFLKKEVDVSGKCANTSKTSFYTCDEPV